MILTNLKFLSEKIAKVFFLCKRATTALPRQLIILVVPWDGFEPPTSSL
jgi:hypothetical protein